MSIRDFTYWGECGECGEAMDERDAYQCQRCDAWICRNCWGHDGSWMCCCCQQEVEEDEEEDKMVGYPGRED